MVIDGIDFMIYEQKKNGFNPVWYSHKFEGPGLRYKVGTCIATGDVVWYYGPFPCGGYPDLSIFRLKLKQLLGNSEVVVADKGYKGDTKTCTPRDSKDEQHRDAMNRTRARHEQINSRICIFGCFRTVFRHKIDKHHLFFKAALTMTQIGIENGRTPFAITDYIDSAFSLDNYAQEQGLGHLL
jgi:hypothetical protein